MMVNQQAMQILKIREQVQEQDTLELQQKRENFLGWLNEINCIDLGHSETIKPESNFALCSFYKNINPIKTFEMYMLNNEVLKTNQEEFFNLNLLHNTRTKINSETCLECDKLPFDRVVPLMCEIILSLMRAKIHFAVFFAKGQRSPHIRIYDWYDLQELNPMQRIKLQIDFWRRHVPFGCFHYFDTGIFIDEHPLQLEFALHWKYQTLFNLLFEWIPEQENPVWYYMGGQKIR